MKGLIPVYHAAGQRACGGMAITVRKKHPLPEWGTFPADNVVKPDGTAPVRGEIPQCATCGVFIDSFAELSYARGRTPEAGPRRRIR